MTLPPELVATIYEYDNTYKEEFDKTLRKISLDGVLSRISKMDNEFQLAALSGRNVGYYSFIHKYFPDAENTIRILNIAIIHVLYPIKIRRI